MTKLTVNSIAKQAFNSVSTKIDGVIQTGMISRTVENDTWDVLLGHRSKGTFTKLKCRAVGITTSVKKDKTFGDFAWSDGDQAFFLEGLTGSPLLGDKFSVGTITEITDYVFGSKGNFLIVAIQDLLVSGTVFLIIGRYQKVVSDPIYIPTLPTDLTAVAGNNQVVLSWTKSTAGIAGTINYDIEYKEGNSGDFEPVIDVGDVDTHTITGLNMSTLYEFKIRSSNVYTSDNIYKSNWTDVVTATTPTGFASKIVLDSANKNAADVEFYDDKFWVPDFIAEKVFVYNKDSTRAAANDFDLDHNNDHSTGITYYSNKFWITDNVRNKVFAYQTDGVYVSASDFDLDSNNGSPVGIATANSKFYVADSSDDKVYVYDDSKNRSASDDFNLINTDAHGITYFTNQFWVPDTIADKIYSYQSDGTRATSPVDITLLKTLPTGVCAADSRLWVVDDATPPDITPYTI